MDSATIASWIAHAAFWILLAYGWLIDELRLRGVIGFLLCWAAGLYALSYFPAGADTAFVAVLDIALVFLIFKGDVRLT